MRYENREYGRELVGLKVNEVLLRGRGFRKDRFRLFTDSGEAWYKTFSVGLDLCCQEAYHILGLDVGADNRVSAVGSGVMYMEDGGGCGCMFSFSAGDEGEGDVDNLDPASLHNLSRPWDEDEEEEEPEPEPDDEAFEDDEEDWDMPSKKQVMDILPLSDMLVGRTPFALSHEAAMLKLGRFLPENSSPIGLALPKALSGLLGEGGIPEEQDARDLLGDLGLTVEEDTDNSCGFTYSTLADRGRRYWVCRLSASRMDGSWRVSSFEVDSYPSTGSFNGNLFNRPHALGTMPHDERQAQLVLADVMDEREFFGLLARDRIWFGG